jgi:hypothetical protein
MKQANLGRRGRAVKNQAATGPDSRTELAREFHADNPHSDSTGTGDSIQIGIAMLIDLLAREALETVNSKQTDLEARDEERQGRTQSGKPNEIAIADPGVTKTKSSSASIVERISIQGSM